MTLQLQDNMFNTNGLEKEERLEKEALFVLTELDRMIRLTV